MGTTSAKPPLQLKTRLTLLLFCLQLDIYACDAGNIDGPQYYGRTAHAYATLRIEFDFQMASETTLIDVRPFIRGWK